MNQRLPSLNIYRPADGIGLEQLEAVRDWALNDGGLKTGDLKAFLWPAFKPQAKLIDSDELRHFHAHPDIDIKLNEDVLGHLDAHVQANLPTTAREKLTAKLLPTDVHSYSPFKTRQEETRDVLKVAISETIMAERFVARLAVCDFFALDHEKLPDGIWLPDEHVVGVHFVRGETDRQKEAVGRLVAVLKTNPDRLPELPAKLAFGQARSKPSRSWSAYARRRAA